MKKGILIKIGFILVLVALNFTPLRAEELRTLNFSTMWEAESLDPAQSGAVESMVGIGSFYETLVTFKGETFELAPCLATSWEVSKDGKSLTFHLRKGVKFHDSTELTAEDVRYSYERMIKTSLKPPSQILGKLTTPEKLVVLDRYTFRLDLIEQTPRIFSILTNPLFPVVSKDYVKKHSTEGDPYGLSWMRNNAMGTGPWKLEKWSVNEKLTMNRHDEYWGEKPHFNRLVINIINDPAVAQMMLEKGDLDIATKLKTDQYSALEKVKDVAVKSFPSLKTVYIRINCSKKPLDDVRVRQALNYAINYDELIKHIELGRATRIYSTLPNNLWGRNPDVRPKYIYDPEKAKSLLKEAGLDKGFEITLLYSPGRYPGFEDTVPYIVSYLSKIGINAKVQKLAFTTQLAVMKKGEFGLALDTWTPFYPDPREFMYYFYHSELWKAGGWSFSFWENQTTDKLVTEAENIMDQKERERRYKEVEQIGVENAVYINLYQTTESIAFRRNIKNVEWHPTLWFKGFKSIDKD